MSADEVLAGGVANFGAVVRRGDVVLRPATENTALIHELLAHVRGSGFAGVPEPRGLATDGREMLEYVAGEVPIPPFPLWSTRDGALVSTAALLRQFHDASVGISSHGNWNRELADTVEGDVICHNDVCPENVVFREGIAVALLDFEFAAPGRRVFDLASFARLCVPIDSPEDAVRSGRGDLDPFRRLRLVADAYGLARGRAELIDVLGEQIARGGAFVQRRVDAGEEAFIAMWNANGGAERYERRRQWFARHKKRFLDTVG